MRRTAPTSRRAAPTPRPQDNRIGASGALVAVRWGLDHYDDARILNVGCNDEHSIRDIALAIADQLGIDRSRPAGIARRRTDNAEFVKRSGFRFTPFREGLRRTVAWYVSHVGRHGGDRPAC